MQDFFCPRCGRRMPDGHCSYCENRARRKVCPSPGDPDGAYNAERHNVERHNAERHNAERHNAERHNAERHNAERHNAERHNAGRNNAERNNAERNIERKSSPALTEEKIISFESIKDSGAVKRGRPRSMGGGKQDIVLDFIDLEEKDRGNNKNTVRGDGAGTGRSRKRTQPKRQAAGGAVARWFSERVEAIKRFADELINPEEE